ncbi:MAG TPA: lysine--tRNA ligase [Actinomycetota bacterium]
MSDDPSGPSGSEPAGEEPRGRLQEVIRARRDALARLRERGIEPFALRFDKNADAKDLHERYGELDPGAETDDRRAVAGRIVLLRRQGRLSFATLRDTTGDIQLFLSQAVMGQAYEVVELLDLGDIVGAEGPVVKTKRGELSIKVEQLTLLTKAHRPMPEKWHGLRDPEARHRRRYLDLASNPESRRAVWARAKVLKAFRKVLDDRGFVEVETPALQATHGGAMARPFITHHRVLDMPLYLRIAPELYLKRLLVGGIERVYEIGRNFRNEGLDREHNPEFTMLEAYLAYGTYEDMMELAEALIREAAMAVRGSLRFQYQGRELDFEPPWRRITLLEAVSEAVGETVTLDRASLEKLAERMDVSVEPGWGPGKILLELYEKRAEHLVWDPTFVMDFPREVSPLARPHRTAPGLTEQFDHMIAGMEIGPAYSELTDPDEQRARFVDQQRLRRGGDEEAHPLDEDFLEALEHGMPPAGGIGVGVDRVTMIMADVPSIRDVILFPHLRPARAEGGVQGGSGPAQRSGAD